jgi:hypothetical protein
MLSSLHHHPHLDARPPTHRCLQPHLPSHPHRQLEQEPPMKTLDALIADLITGEFLILDITQTEDGPEADGFYIDAEIAATIGNLIMTKLCAQASQACQHAT